MRAKVERLREMIRDYEAACEYEGTGPNHLFEAFEILQEFEQHFEDVNLK